MGDRTASTVKMEEGTHDMNSDLFAQIDDLLDFPAEDVDAAVGADLHSWPKNDMFGVNTGFTFSECSSEHELSVPCDDIAELEWLSNFVEESFSTGNMEAEFENRNEGTNAKLCRPSSPVSVVDSSTSSMHDIVPSVPAQARTKRPRPPAVPLHPTVLTASATATTMVISPSSSISNFSYEFTYEDKCLSESKVAKKGGTKKMTSTEKTSLAARKCLHCESQKTPQWRMGPLGPKTLCNACGVRYKSGRLFPEYRPAASPTFVSTKHSNSHKRVLEMRVMPRSVVEDNLSVGGTKEMELVYQRNPITSYM